MTRPEPVQGCHARQVKYQIGRGGEPTIMADDTPVKAAVTVIAIAYLSHKEAAALLRQLAREIEQQP